MFLLLHMAKIDIFRSYQKLVFGLLSKDENQSY